MKVKLIQNENSVQLKFSDEGYIYANDKELEPNLTWRTRVIDDGTHQGVIKYDQIILFDIPSNNGCREVKMYSYRCDVNHLFKVINKLRQKHLLQLHKWVSDGNDDWKFKDTKYEIDLNRIQLPIYEVPQLTFQQIAHHPNLRNKEYLAATLKHFKNKVKPEQFVRLKEEISRYLPRSIFFAHTDEFYFDGRKLENGTGFNGGFIVHGDEWSIHT